LAAGSACTTKSSSHFISVENEEVVVKGLFEFKKKSEKDF
jgi:hypothetical protein